MMEPDPEDVMDTSPIIVKDSDDVMDNPPVIYHDPDDIMDTSPVTDKDPDDVMSAPPVTDQKPDDVMCAPPVTDQEPDDVMCAPPVTDQKPDDVMSAPLVTDQEPDDVMSAPPVTDQKPDDVMSAPLMTDQEPDDVMCAPPVMHQESRDVMINPPMTDSPFATDRDNFKGKHQEDPGKNDYQSQIHPCIDTLKFSKSNQGQYTENPNKASYDPVMTDSATKTEIHVQPTLVPFTLLDQRKEQSQCVKESTDHNNKINTLATSNQEHEEHKGNVIPVEEGSNPKLDGQAGITVASDFDDLSYSSTDHRVPNLTVALFGNSAAVQFGCNNILLGEKQLHPENAEFSMIIPSQRKISEHHVTVINIIDSHETDLRPFDNVISHLLNENEIHAFIFVVQLGQLTDADKMGIEWLQSIFGDRVLPFVMTLFTYDRDEECDTIIDELKKNSVLEQLVEKCRQRYHTCRKTMSNQSEMRELMDRIERLHIENNKQCYTSEMFSDVRKPQNSEFKSGPETDISTKTQPFGSSDKANRRKLSAEQLIHRLHLECENQKLTTADFLQLTIQSQSHESCTEEKLAKIYLQKLLMMDYRARCMQTQENKEQDRTQQIYLSEDVDDAFNDIFKEMPKLPDENNKLDSVHLMDVQMALFHCADSFLKQLMVTKLAQCQYALPLLVPSPFTQQIEFPLWTFRQINKSWKKTDDTGNLFSQFQPVYKAETPMVAFFRFGSVSSSKSQLMNNLINEKHNTFFHRDCPGSSRISVLMDGVVEIAWYCPSGEKSDKYTDCVAFCNLHGDAGDNEKQLDIITELASVNVVILPQLNRNDSNMTKIQNFYKGSKPLICLLTENDSAITEIRKGKYKIGLKDRNQSDVFEELRRAIKNGLSNPELSSKSPSFFKLEDMAKYSDIIRVDEDDNDDCKKGKEAAQKMMDLLKNKQLTEIKESFLPCQGKLWHQWCQKNKELHRPTLGEVHKGKNIEKIKCSKKSEMHKIREQQQTSVLSQFIQLFIQNLNSEGGNATAYFLKWLGILLDDFTTENLSALHHEYDEKWSAVLNLKKKHDKSQQLTAKQIELERLSEKLQAATFGVEHMLREIGQIYESCSCMKKNKKDLKLNFSSLPMLAARMMISGFPLELMDGDAAHVPLFWVTAVLDELIKTLGNQRVFVLSVLGIQSSGKSTMLNAMFGLQFAVSAGRCTRGAFMQLVRVSEEMKAQLKFDYILVVDTEGLRALELAGRSTRNHDNEMATFVVGLGNMTLINIFGENTSEMQDILQIVVQAVLRMKKVKLNPSCMFVHQNVSDITAGEKNMEGRRRLQEKLDEMTKLAAKEEDCDKEFFSDVIAFDIQNDVKYFAQLWEGSPPMAPPNPDYSRNIQELKNTILSNASKASCFTLSQFKTRVTDLWNALLNENFVFSFKNTLEIAAYRKLETEYSDWTWSLRSAMMSIEEKFYNRIANGTVKVQEHDLLNDMRKTKDEVEKSVKSYFEEDRDKDILCEWRGRFETRIKELHDDLVKGTKRKLDEAIEQKIAREKLDTKRTECENKLFSRSKELALSLKGKDIDEHVQQQEFDAMWSKWVTEMTEDTPKLKDFNFWEDVTQILSENHEINLVHERFSQTDFKTIYRRGDYCDYIVLKKHLERFDDTVPSEETDENSKKSKSRTFKQFLMYSAQKMMSGFKYDTGLQKQTENKDPKAEYHYSVRNLIQKTVQETEKIIKNSPVEKRGFNESYIQEITDCVKKSVQQHQLENQNYILKKEFSVDLCLHVCDIARQTFTELHQKFREANDPRIYLEKQKTQYSDVFKNYHKGATTTTILSEWICSILEPSILEAVYNITALDLADKMRSDIKALKENRPNLEKHILKSLAMKEDFAQYIEYIHNPRQHFKQFIKNEVDMYFAKQSKTIIKMFIGNLKQKERIVSNAVQVATVEVKNKQGDGDMWLRSFTKILIDELKFTGNSCVDLKDIKDLDFLEKVLSDSLKERMAKLHVSFKSITDINMEKCRKRPDEILIDHFCQCCWVQCPFCKAICTNTMEDHPGDHSVPFHHSIGMNGCFYRGTTNLCVHICTTAVASDLGFYPNSSDDIVPFKEYRKGGQIYANWSITPDLSELPYWKWFVCRFQKDLEKYYSKTFQGDGEIPDEWKRCQKKEAMECLDKYI
ncbi:interferon-induced very large GTPase 1 [Xyrauchen texanus]|uniref:interferon-induced very large GTPase 1 n=1 Tax=Xyrauchen texanus TaxID=154827 RepID=UPI002241BC5A|nr:interferon-induced very large GTPase 1 [Xyrauchen texanus]XP_051989352.1 interferon-induced very large GTPase 1 [Xyrauchen texanus]